MGDRMILGKWTVASKPHGAEAWESTSEFLGTLHSVKIAVRRKSKSAGPEVDWCVTDGTYTFLLCPRLWTDWRCTGPKVPR